MPTGVVYVGRGTRWGNPFEVGVHGDRLECLKLYVAVAFGFLCISAKNVPLQERAIKALRRVKDLRGKDLACWCRPDQECHADVLLALANDQRLPEHWLPKLQRVG